MLSIFTKAEYKEIMLPFEYVHSKEDDELGGISITAFGNILGEMKYCYACYVFKDKNMYNNGDYEQIINLLKHHNSNKTIKVKIKVKNNKVKDFIIDLKSLADVYNDNRFIKLDLVGWGLHNDSIENNIVE